MGKEIRPEDIQRILTFLKHAREAAENLGMAMALHYIERAEEEARTALDLLQEGKEEAARVRLGRAFKNVQKARNAWKKRKLIKVEA